VSSTSLSSVRSAGPPRSTVAIEVEPAPPGTTNSMPFAVIVRATRSTCVIGPSTSNSFTGASAAV
jgi:hypothetical protein